MRQHRRLECQSRIDGVRRLQRILGPHVGVELGDDLDDDGSRAGCRVKNLDERGFRGAEFWEGQGRARG